MSTGDERRKLGDSTARELLRAARGEAIELGKALDREGGVDKLVERAYIGSIAARISVALDKLERGED